MLHTASYCETCVRSVLLYYKSRAYDALRGPWQRALHAPRHLLNHGNHHLCYPVKRIYEKDKHVMKSPAFDQDEALALLLNGHIDTVLAVDATNG
jgi:hypothetical protein